ncbi:MAG: RsmD family RNA methyltransferase, partial [Candidatus Methanoperedens sp.]
PEECLLDPFAGTGGILIEAGMIGIKVIGSDVQRKLLLGAKTNLDYYNVDYSLMYQDAARLALRDKSVDSVVTDPPYGRSAAVKAESIEHLLKDSLNEIFRVLKKGKRAVFVSERDIEDVAKEAGFNVAESHLQRVHKSLTRRISVLEKR